MTTKKSPEILIVTTKADIATDYVILKLNKLKANIFRLNTEDFPLLLTSSFTNVNLFNNSEWEWKDNSKVYDLSKLKAVWYRRHRLPEMPLEMSAAHSEYCLRESDWYLKGMLWQLEFCNSKIRWMSCPSRLRIADSKIFQLKIANNLGFKIPETLISTNPDDIRRFFNKFQGNIIVKPLRLGYFDYGDYQTSVYTSKLNWEDLQVDDEIKIAPVIYQRHIQKKFDIRVTVIEEKVYTAAIDSQTIPSAVLDWRKTETDEIGHFAHSLPEDIETKCKMLLKILGLKFGAIDLVLTPQNEYYFLEINPNGQWVWLEDKLGFPVSNEIATWLKQ